MLEAEVIEAQGCDPWGESLKRVRVSSITPNIFRAEGPPRIASRSIVNRGSRVAGGMLVSNGLGDHDANVRIRSLVEK